MVDDLTRQSVDTLKALGEAGIQMIKVLAAMLNLLAQKIANCETETDKNQCIDSFNKQVDDLLKGKMAVGEFSKEVKDSAVMEIPDDVVADMFELELQYNDFDYARMGDKSFAVRGGDVEVLNHIVKQTAANLDNMKDLPKEQIKSQTQEKLKLAKMGIKEKQVESLAKGRKKVKDVVSNLKDKSEKKDHNRQREKQKTKSKQADR